MSELFVVIPSWMTVAQAEVFMNELRFAVGYGEAVYGGFSSSVTTRKYQVKFLYTHEENTEWTDDSWVNRFYLLMYNENFPGVHVRNAINLRGNHLIDYILRNERIE